MKGWINMISENEYKRAQKIIIKYRMQKLPMKDVECSILAEAGKDGVIFALTDEEIADRIFAENKENYIMHKKVLINPTSILKHLKWQPK